MYQLNIRYTKGQSNIPSGHKIWQHLPFQGPPKCSQTGIFGLKIYHLATLYVDRARARGRMQTRIWGKKQFVNIKENRADPGVCQGDRMSLWKNRPNCFFFAQNLHITFTVETWATFVIFKNYQMKCK
jgi:hypothetical protein